MTPTEAKGLTFLGPAEAVRIPHREDRAFLKKLARATVMRAVLAGMLVASAVATTELLARASSPAAIARSNTAQRPRGRREPERKESQVGLGARSRVGLLVLQTLLLASLVEFFYLTWAGHRAARNLSRAVGQPPFPEAESFERGEMPGLLAQVALRAPVRPPALFTLGAPPLLSRWRVALGFFAFQAKVVASVVLLRWLCRWAAGPDAEPFVPWLALPVFAAWNARWMFVAMREVRRKALGPGMAQELLQTIFQGNPPVGPLGRPAVLRAVETVLGKKGAAHPDQVALLAELRRKLGSASGDPKETWRHFLDKVSMLSKVEQKVLLQCLAAAISLAGDVTPEDFGPLREALVACNKPASDDPAWRLRRALTRAEPVPPELVNGIG